MLQSFELQTFFFIINLAKFFVKIGVIFQLF